MAARRQFGSTWWGHAWTDALEQRARLDPNRLPRGRTYARQDRAGRLVVGPGTISAGVQGSRPSPYQVRIDVRVFSEAEWEIVISAITARVAHAAALLDGELLPEVLDEVRGAGVDLLPGPGDLDPHCSCPDWADPCKHAAAVCYLMADVLDEDPFELFHLRGRPRDQLLGALRDRRRALAPPPAPDGEPNASDPVPTRAEARQVPAAERFGPIAREAFARPQPTAEDLWALGGPTPAAHPGHPAPVAVPPPKRSGIDPDDLLQLASDAASRAWELQRGEGDGGLTLPLDRDLARRAATLLGTRGFASLAERSGRPSRHLVRHALAWRHGAEEGIEVLTESWTPDPELLEEGRAALAASTAITLRTTDISPRLIKVRANTVTARDVQLRLARSGRWYRFAKVTGHWELDDGPAADPATLLTPGA